MEYFLFQSLKASRKKHLFALVAQYTLKSVIKLGKDSTNKWEQTNIVYKFNCKNCPVTYIGKSKRTLRVRINEHKN